ncbi:aromatic ring-hydroxylating oxygenase subunit alpha [Noviherbaspirillum sp. Root189]|uniref:aromatic ring-hydroxylating oxygenase subunit alpha n=1 Tax=Noviherbaspirillum sp. Root189 TaxID=1736487 RepID=UPI000710D6CC|nr:Rieske 2Fe-2S domain-containing protein [Noviherbaspirillum sp. Root189]KRB83459.1 ring-hydroxylating oxygenase subunit alpha [Noviherbaspirillum sp. Root189]
MAHQKTVKIFPAKSTIDLDYLIQEERVHGSLYTNTDLFEQEMRQIFYGGWVFVGHDSEIPAAGEYQRRTIGREEVIMVRQKDNSIAVLSNRCAHRGNLMCINKSGKTKYLTCAYHGWVYGLDGKLLDVPYPGGFPKSKEGIGLNALRTEEYRGFVFATFNEAVGPLADHLGKAKVLIDRACDMSPVGRIKLTAGWVKQRFDANWKMLPENDTDGYHVNYVHSSFARVIDSHYNAAAIATEESLVSETKDWGNGHTELFFSPSYKEYFEWLGVKGDRYPEYAQQLKNSYGEEKGDRILRDGPPHAAIFPNLFLGEMNIVIFEPVNAHQCIQWHTPMLLEGVPDEVNQRILRQSEAALGPSAFLLADDSVISERQQLAMRDQAGWLDVSRGMNRDVVDAEGIITGHVTDECTNRGFWRHYKKVMQKELPVQQKETEEPSCSH